MTIKRLVVLWLFLGAGFRAIFLLPKVAMTQPVGIKLELPQFVGKWYGVDQAITERELAMLAADTEFARKVYTDATGNVIFVSIVLSGADLDNSIHRPERCLPAQGWTIADTRSLPLPLESGKKLEVTRLHDVRQVLLTQWRDGFALQPELLLVRRLSSPDRVAPRAHHARHRGSRFQRLQPTLGLHHRRG